MDLNACWLPSTCWNNFDFCPSALAIPWCAWACKGHSKRKWCTVSTVSKHDAQFGEATLPIQCRKLLRGACPVHSCMRTHDQLIGHSDKGMRWQLVIDIH